MATPMGSLIIALEGAVQDLNITDQDELDEYLLYLVEYLPDGLRQNLNTWRYNWHDRECARQRYVEDSIVQVNENDRMQKHKAEYAKEQAARKTHG